MLSLARVHSSGILHNSLIPHRAPSNVPTHAYSLRHFVVKGGGFQAEWGMRVLLVDFAAATIHECNGAAPLTQCAQLEFDDMVGGCQELVQMEARIALRMDCDLWGL
jgi:hypothetical protein